MPLKTISSELTTILTDEHTRPEYRSLAKYVAFLIAVVALFSLAFHQIMAWEGRSHSWITSVYWTFTVMSTLGFGDITFASDLGRGFSVVVLLTGMVLLLIVMPFVFIRFFYAPWLEAQLHARAPRAVPARLRDHVIFCHYDEVARGLIDMLGPRQVPYVLLEPDTAQAALLHRSGVKVVCGPIDSRKTLEAAGFERARLLVANADDAMNANITLTARELSATVEIVATVLDADAVDVLELAGANRALALRRQLGEHLANRVSVGKHRLHVVGRYGEVVIAEFPIRNTSVSGKTLAEAQIRSRTGVTVPVLARRGAVVAGLPETVLQDDCIGIAVGQAEQMGALDALLGADEEGAVLVIGGGKVGRNAARTLKRRGLRVNMLEKLDSLRGPLETIADSVVIGDAADLDVIRAAGIKEVSSVILTTNDDTVNIFIAIYCRKLNPETIIISRIRHRRNIEAIHRAGADFVLSDPALGVQTILRRLDNRELVLVGEGLDVFDVPVPRSLVGKSLHETDIRRRTGLSVIAIDYDGRVDGAPSPDVRLPAGARLLFIGTPEQAAELDRQFG